MQIWWVSDEATSFPDYLLTETLDIVRRNVRKTTGQLTRRVVNVVRGDTGKPRRLWLAQAICSTFVPSLLKS